MPLESKAYVAAAWIGIVLLAVACILVLGNGNWFGGSLLAVFLLASVAFVVGDEDLPGLFDLLFVAAAIINAAGWVWDLYRRIPGYDEAAHFYTSFAVTLSLSYLVYRRVREPFREHRLHFVLVIASFGISLGAFWEIFELLVLKELLNPVVDIIMDSLGAVLAGIGAAVSLGLEQPRDGGN
jgi:hypothetical protein